jgi:membrane-bound serine protease (ClpP class)
VVSGREELLDGIGVVVGDFDGNGRIRIHSEDWNARSDTALRAGQRVRVTGIDGLVLEVQPETEKMEKSS